MSIRPVSEYPMLPTAASGSLSGLATQQGFLVSTLTRVFGEFGFTINRLINRTRFGALADRPDPGEADRFFLATDTLQLFYDDGSDWQDLGAVPFAPEHATDGGTDEYDSATNTSPPGDGEVIVRDFQSANETTTPELDGIVCTTKDGSALWAGALSGVHELQYASSGPAWRVVDPNPIDEDDMASDSDAAVPTQQSVKAYVDQRVAPITADDDGNLTWHEVHRQSVGSDSFATIFDLSGSIELIDGSIMGSFIGFRLTVDGVVFDRLSGISGDDNVGNSVSIVSVPTAKAESSMKLEAYNNSGDANELGWRVVTR